MSTERKPPRVTVFRDWTPALLRSAEVAAESGNLGSAVSLCEWMLTDDAVAGALQARSDALLGLEPTFAPGRLVSADAMQTFAEDFGAMYPEAELSQLHEFALLLGVSLARHATQVDDETGRWLTPIEFWPASTLRQDQRTGEWFVRDADGKELPVTAGDGVWLLHTPYGPNRPWARGLWRSLARWCLLKQMAQRDWARHSEVGARLFAQTQLDRDGNAPATTDEQRQQIVEELYNAGGELVACLPPGWTVQLLELSANTEAIYKAQIEAANNAIRIRIRGGDLSSDAGDGGSFAAAESQAASNEAPKRRYDGKTLSATLHDQSSVWWATYNYGVAQVAPYVTWAPSVEETAPDVTNVATAVATLVNAGAEVDAETLRTKYGLDFLLSIKRPLQPAGPFGVAAEADGSIVAAADDRGDAVTPEPGQGPTPDPKTPPATRGETAEATEFVDALTAEAAAEAQRLAGDVVATLQRVVAAATGPDDLERRIREAFGELDTSEIEALTEQAAILAELAGRYAALSEL